ncbi:MAG TPA: 2-aminoethylphosphonate--pyruvate transaminase, partial [Aliiroseovarius sp.]|nr:2-aminoethylphosphonate--pyruvate transaminase [Aliiroseovarius sp.]
ITTFFCPADPAFSFDGFYNAMKEKGFIIYPGKLTEVESFRLGHIGQVDEHVMRAVARAAKDALSQLGVTSAAPPETAMRERARLTV